MHRACGAKRNNRLHHRDAVRNITNCTFGGRGRQTLYVTTAVDEKHRERLAGGLFALRTENLGQPENRFYAFSLPPRF